METRPNDNFPWRHVYIASQHVARNMRKLDSEYSSSVLKKGHKDEVWTMHLVGDRLLSASSDRTVKVWNTKQLECLHTLKGHTGGVWALGADFEANIIVSGDTDGFVHVWDSQTGELRSSFQAHHATISCLQVDEGLVITGSFDNSIAIHDLATGQRRQVLQGSRHGGHKFHVNALRYAQGRVASGGWDCRVLVWDVAEGRGVMSLEGHTGPIRAIEFDGSRVVSGSWDGTIKLFDLAAKGSQMCLCTLEGHTGPVSCLAIDATKLVSGSYDGTVKIWDLTGAPPPCIRTLKANKGGVQCVRMDWRRIYAGGKDKKIKIFDFSAGHI